MCASAVWSRQCRLTVTQLFTLYDLKVQLSFSGKAGDVELGGKIKARGARVLLCALLM